MHVVGIGMRHTCKHLADDQPLQATFHRLDFFHAADLQAFRSQRVGHLLSRQFKIDILFQPIIRDIHIL